MAHVGVAGEQDVRGRGGITQQQAAGRSSARKKPTRSYPYTKATHLLSSFFLSTTSSLKLLYNSKRLQAQGVQQALASCESGGHSRSAFQALPGLPVP